MKPTLSLSLNQHLAMTPQLQQSIRLLQLSTQALDMEIKIQLDNNPFLEIESELPQGASENANVMTPYNIYNSYNTQYNNTNSASDKMREYQEWLYNRQNDLSLKEHLLWQMNVGSFSVREQIIASLIIDSINDEGYLATPLDELQESLKLQYPDQETFEITEIEDCLRKIHNFEPTGIGSRTLLECLSLQLINLPKNTPFLKQTLTALNYLDLLAKRDFIQIQKKLMISDAELEGIRHLIKSLNPKPGTKYLDIKGNYVIPDLKVIKKKELYKVELNTNIIPKISLNSEFMNRVKSKGFEKMNESMKTYFSEAKLFLKALQIRHTTLLKVAEQIVVHQQKFFAHGLEYLQPLSLNTIAHECGLHESTVSRVTTQKFLDTPQGLFELKYFFSPMLPKNQSHSEQPTEKHTCNKAIRALVKKWIANESPQEPLSDAKISSMLLKEGIQISRRTVTKYRELMNIPSSQQRQSFTGAKKEVK